MISKSKEVQENPHRFISNCPLHLSTAQEKDSHSNHKLAKDNRINVLKGEYDGEHFIPSNSFSQILEESSGESVTSLERQLTFEHLTCLEANISEIGKHILKIPKNMDLTKLQEWQNEENQEALSKFIWGHSSPIPLAQQRRFLDMLRQNSSLRKVMMWIYGHVQSQLSDELIVAAHRIALAYDPIRLLVTGATELSKLADMEFNVMNVYWDPALTMINYSRLLQVQEEGIVYNAQLHRFFRFYLVTILLVLEEYYENPYYANIISVKVNLNEKKELAGLGKTKMINKRRNVKL